MRRLAGILVVMMVMGLAQYAGGASDPQTSKMSAQAMTMAELEKAGDASQAQKNYGQAIVYFKGALRRERKNDRLWNKLGLAQLQLSDLRAARSSFEQAAKRNPKSAEAFNNIGAVAYIQKNYGNAAKYFKKALALEETHATFHVNLGAAWFGQNKLDKALAEYARAVELDPEILTRHSLTGVTAQISSPEERARYSYMLAKIYARKGDTDRCLECLRKAKEEGYRDLKNVYSEYEFQGLWQDARLSEIVPPPKK